MTMFYAAKVKKDPEISVAYESDQYFRDQNENRHDEEDSFGSGPYLSSGNTGRYRCLGHLGSVMAKGYYIRNRNPVLHHGNCGRV